MKIYTITLNPAYDIHADADDFAAGHECLATVTSRDAGGKGVNISRALCACNVENTAVIVLGKENAGDFRRDIAYMDTLLLEREGRIRENLTLHSNNSPETRISFRGFAVDDTILVKGVETMAGSRILEGFKPLFSAEAVVRLENKGYSIAGKTNVGEFGLDLAGEFSYYA